MTSTMNGDGWALEVVRGKDAGRVFALGAGEIVLGNAPGEAGGLDLADQESAASPRRMAGRHAALECSPRGLAVRDLESPGGTFVNRQRVLPGKSTPLRAGDVIQLGGVQLKVVAKSPTTGGAPPLPNPPPRGGEGTRGEDRLTPSSRQQRPPSPLVGEGWGEGVVESRENKARASAPFSFVIRGGTTCRTWDDFLTASAQRWELVRDELTSGRLAAFLGSICRPDLAPSPTFRGTPDERLDAWLGGLPTSKVARPELDVHPSRLVIRVSPGGGVVRKSVHVANVGYRLLRSTARVEPPGLSWLAIPPEFAGKPFATVDGTDLPVDLTIPETLAGPLKAELVIEGNGGSKWVEVVLEVKPSTVEEGAPEAPAPASGATLAELIAWQSPVARVATWGMAALALRLVVGVAGGSIGEDAMTASGPEIPRLAGVALVLGVVGSLAGAGLAARRGGWREAPPGGFAGACAGVIASSGLVAACRSIEPALGGWSTSILAVCALWALLGAGLAVLSALVFKGKT